MKSKIRSRWHRPNEKPLENDGSRAPTAAPVGEIDPSSVSVLTDDLSNFKPDPNAANKPRSSESPHGRRNDRGKPGNRRSQPRNEERNTPSNRENQPAREDRSKSSSDHPNKRHGKRRHNPGKSNSENSNHSRKQAPKHSGKSPAKAPQKAGGIKGFLGKLFG